MFQISHFKITGFKRQPQNIKDIDNKSEKNNNGINDEVIANKNEIKIITMINTKK